MKKATTPNLPLILADYTEFVIQQERRRQQFRDAVAGPTEILTPAPEAGTWTRWNISDRD